MEQPDLDSVFGNPEIKLSLCKGSGKLTLLCMATKRNWRRDRLSFPLAGSGICDLVSLPPEYQAQEMSVGKAAVVLSLTNNHQVHGWNDKHALVTGANRRNHITRRFPA